MFVLYATSSANAAAHKGNRKTITGGDVISAMSDMEFDKVISKLATRIFYFGRMNIFSLCVHLKTV